MKLDNLLFVMAGVLSLAFFLAFVLLSVEYTDKEPREWQSFGVSAGHRRW